MKYSTDEKHKDSVKKESILKYATDINHKDYVKKKSVQKYERIKAIGNVSKREVSRNTQQTKNIGIKSK